MIKCAITGKKLTANQLAKELLVDHMQIALEFWRESILVNEHLMTEKELKDIDEQIWKRYWGVKKYLGIR